MTLTTTLFDVLIIGGGPAGLSAAMTVARALHTAVVFDSHTYRNLLAKNMHAVTTWDHRPPQEFRDTAKRSILERYNTICFEDVRINSLQKTHKGIFHLVDENGKVWLGRKLLLATGVKDVFPDISGYDECWVSGIFHCLFCHGYEDRNVNSSGVLAMGDLSLPPAALHVTRHARRLTPKVTVYTNGESGEGIQKLLLPDEDIHIDTREISRLVKGREQATVILQFNDGTEVTEGFLVNRPNSELAGDFTRQLNLQLTEAGDIKVTEPMFTTSEPGVYAAGDCAVLAKTVMNAMATGGLAGASICAALQAEGPVDASL